MTYLRFSRMRSGFRLTSASRMRSAWLMSSQKMMVFWNGSDALRNSVTFCATIWVRASITKLRSISLRL
ncbi:hypothetical protein D9M69_652320 [compost metagenome]